MCGEWFQDDAGTDWRPEELPNPYPELAVALGAAYYGLVRLGEGVRVGAGSPRAYFVQVAAADQTDDSSETVSAPISAMGEGRDEGADATGGIPAVCLVPRGAEEGFAGELRQPAFEVLANQPVAFQLFSSTTRLGDRVGDVVSAEP